MPQPCQHVVCKPPRVYCLGGHTDVKASEAGAVGNSTVNFTWFQISQVSTWDVWRGMWPLADADPQEFLRSADWCRSWKFTDVDACGSSFKQEIRSVELWVCPMQLFHFCLNSENYIFNHMMFIQFKICCCVQNLGWFSLLLVCMSMSWTIPGQPRNTVFIRRV